MCTVTFIPARDVIYLTSNRDEKNWRSDALPPAIYPFHSGKLIFPRDGDAGGTWIAAHENGNVVIFLNGGFRAHKPTPPYRKSRGLVLLDLVDHFTPINSFLVMNMNNIEPFTAIIRDNGHLFECRWNGEEKHYQELDTHSPHIWSSATLYSETVMEKRKKWFGEWIASNANPSQEDILNFHQFTGDGDSTNDLRMNREGKVFTVSITSIEITTTGLKMDYLDLKNNESFSEQMLFETSIAGK